MSDVVAPTIGTTSPEVARLAFVSYFMSIWGLSLVRAMTAAREVPLPMGEMVPPFEKLIAMCDEVALRTLSQPSGD